MRALLEVLPLQIPALRPSGSAAAGAFEPPSRGGKSSSSGSSAQQQEGGDDRGGIGNAAQRLAADARPAIPYVKLCGLRLPDTLTPAVDDPQDAQVGMLLASGCACQSLSCRSGKVHDAAAAALACHRGMALSVEATCWTGARRRRARRWATWRCSCTWPRTTWTGPCCTSSASRHAPSLHLWWLTKPCHASAECLMCLHKCSGLCRRVHNEQ